MPFYLRLPLWVVFGVRVVALPYDPEQVLWNLNQNMTATQPLDYWGEWQHHIYTPSPDNWRFPFYTLMLDRFVNGDPRNDDANGTAWEQDPFGTQLRHGGDVKGFQDSLDYIEGMGLKGIYVVGSPFINFPWGADAFSPLDLTLLDPHFATINAWRECIDEMHRRGMYVLLDNTMATLGDLIGFDGFLNVSTPLSYTEHDALWKTSRRYHDFTFNNQELETCDVPYPRFWDDHGEPVYTNGTENLIGCRASEFNQYGDIAAFDKRPEWQRQITKFASVQDRLREWNPSVREKLEHLSCLQIAMLDIDGYRMDKGQQITVDAMGDFADFIRQCAHRYGKDNFYIPGEIVSGNAFGAVYLGRGKEPKHALNDTDKAVKLTADTADDSLFIRAKGKQAFDGACFHYSTYRSLLRFLGMDGDLGAEGESPTDFMEAWEDFIKTNDMVNANTGEFDPRHMFGAQNQDNFRWPTIIDGTQKQLLGNFITTLLLPGIPLLEWGEEQAFYVHDNTAANYVFGRQPMSSTTAWQDHGCYTVGNGKFGVWPPGNYSRGCEDDWNSLDHRDPAHPIRNIISAMYEMRRRYPVLNDGFYLKTISKQTHPIYLPGSWGTATETGLWSVRRSGWPDQQDFTNTTQRTQDVWIVFHNDDKDTNYIFDCGDAKSGLLAPFNSGTKVKNLLYPYDELTLGSTSSKLKLDDKNDADGCLANFSIPAWGYKAYVPSDQWLRPSPVITKFTPGHDFRILSNSGGSSPLNVSIELFFSDEMDCQGVLNALSCSSTSEDGLAAAIDKDSFSCSLETNVATFTSPFTGTITGQMPGTWKIAGTLLNVSDGVHTVTVGNATNQAGDASTNAVHHFLLRVGMRDNPMIFPRTANYSTSLLYQSDDDSFHIVHKAPGADLFQYSSNWGSSWSEWLPYKGGNTTLHNQPWSGTKEQEWSGHHIQVKYWSQKTGALGFQQGDLAGSTSHHRRLPNIFLHGSWNQYGYDSGLDHSMKQYEDGTWEFDFMTEWPSEYQVNAWGSNPDGQPDLSRAFGDVDLDGVLEIISPVSLLKNVVNVTKFPPKQNLGYAIHVNDGTFRYTNTPIGSSSIQASIFALLAALPILMASLCVWLYLHSFYDIKLNRIGKKHERAILPMAVKEKLHTDRWLKPNTWPLIKRDPTVTPAAPRPATPRRTVLIATMEYNIDDWAIKIKIGGLGVMSQLMGQHLTHVDLIWVVPCVEDIEYPMDQRAKPIICNILGTEYTIQVQYHHVRNITFVLLDAPVFRQQTKAEPYPRRMDDIDSAIYYSAWNSCIAEVLQRFPVDLYHINDYHGAVAPLHLLPKVIPCCLSLHNAEFQGLWPMRTTSEFEEVCKIYNLPADVVRQYVQFGGVFNLLHSGASYLRMHQNGYGAAGVSTKYGKRSFARYPVLWGLKKVMGLPNPDPTDTETAISPQNTFTDVVVDETYEAGRSEQKRLAQEWAGLNQEPEAELFVFVGRWSNQKGIDLIADVFPAILEKHSKVQLMCIGPIIDLYGKFAALKLGKMMEKYPGRVCSKPEFTALPPFVFTGAEFALIPSRDEPFGLVAVEFGRKGALGVGARVGGLGNMPGWWFTVESTTSKHLLSQFKTAIVSALASKTQVRAKMRAISAKQRFPVPQWKADLEIMHDTAIKTSKKQLSLAKAPVSKPPTPGGTRLSTPVNSFSNLSGLWATSRKNTIHSHSVAQSVAASGENTRAPSPLSGAEISRQLSLGVRVGPGHVSVTERQPRGRKRLSKPHPGSRASSTSSTVPRRSIFPLSGRSSRANSSDRGKGTDKDVPALPSQAITMTQSSNTGIMRISEDREEDHANRDEPRLESGVSQFDFSFGNPFDEDRENTSAAEDSDTNSTRRSPAEEYIITPEQVENEREKLRVAALKHSLQVNAGEGCSSQFQRHGSSPSLPGTPSPENMSLMVGTTRPQTPTDSEAAPTAPKEPYLSLGTVLQGKKDFKLQNVVPSFDDPTGLYYEAFEFKLRKLNGKTSEKSLCIEDYLMESEKDWFNRYRSVRLGKSAATSRASSIFRIEREPPEEPMAANRPSSDGGSDNDAGQFLLQDGYKPPMGIQKFMLQRIGTWPLYTFILAFGQIISANSYQIVLLTGEVGQSATKLYVVATVYLVFSIIWWLIFRKLQSKYVLSLPFALYGLAFFLLGLAPYAKAEVFRGWVQNIATAFYAAASSSGAFYFSLNFGSEGCVPIAIWSLRAALIQGVQQLYVVVLWYWGSQLTRLTVSGVRTRNLVAYGPGLTGTAIPIAFIMFAIGATLFQGLPDYYRQTPGHIPSFYRSLTRRKIVMWFFVAVILQNFWLSAPYGRNWTYLWSSKHAARWQIACLVLLFFVGVWAAFLAIFAHLSKTHTWIIPIFAVGLGAPRWCQMLWGTSNLGQWVPWAAGPVAGALVGRCLWLWLGVLDTIQGVGIGMILLQTLTRFHVTFTLVSAQVLGSIATIVARACAPNANGPGKVFPNLGLSLAGLREEVFWIGLICQGVICVGFLWWFRGEQLMKP